MSDNYIERMLSDRERIMLVQRQHPLKLIQYILVELIIIFVIIVGVAILQASMAAVPLISLGYLLVLIPLVSMISKILSWYNHRFIITSRRVIETYGVFSKNVADSSLEKVNDVNMEQSVFGRMFDYGDISVITGSDAGVDTYEMIAHPVQFKKAMLNAKQNMADEGGQRPRNVPALIEELDRLRRAGTITDAEFQRKKEELLNEL